MATGPERSKDYILNELRESREPFDSTNASIDNNNYGHKNVDKLLDQNMEKQDAILQAAMNGFWLTDMQGQILEVNEAYCKMSGYTPKELQSMHIADLEAIETRELIEARARKIQNTGEDKFQSRHKRKDGSSYEVEICIKYHPIKGGIFMVFFQDITKRKLYISELIQAKEQAQESEHILLQKNNELKERNIFIQTILDNLPIGLSLNKFNEGEAIYVNKKFEEIYGWTSKELYSISSFFEKVYPDEHYRNQIIAKIMGDINTGDPSRMHWENIQITRKDGSTGYVNAVNIPLLEQNTMVSTVMDFTELYQAQIDLIKAKEKAEESDRLKSAFLQNMSHEVRTPLNAIVGFSSLMAEPGQTSEKLKNFSETITTSSNKLIGVITDIIEISQIHAKQIMAKCSEFDIISFINNISRSFEKKAQEKNLEFVLKMNIPHKEFYLNSDMEKIERIFTHLFDNSLKFTSTGSIEFICELKNENINFYIADTGIGISDEMQKIIFEPFRQVESGVCRSYGGNGLGLPIVQAYTELLNGKISLKSEVGKGTTFHISMPVIHLKSFPHKEPVKHSSFVNNTILIAEDEYNNYQYLLELIDDNRFSVLHAKNGQQALEMCKTNNSIDLVLMDIKMPIMDGHQAALLIKEFRADLPIIAQTAYALEIEKAQYSDAFDDYITKPIKRNSLYDLINKYFKSPENET